MVEISSSGSGEGPGRATDRGYSTDRAARPSRLTPVAPGRFLLQATVDKGTHDALVRAQELLSHQVASGDVGEVLSRALKLLVAHLEKRKFAATSRPAKAHRPTTSPRHIPAHVKREVWRRDGGRCTFVSDSGQRCPARDHLEFDHVEAVARGGTSTTANLRLRCRAHNEFAAECTFGTEFMEGKRHEAREAAERRAQAQAHESADEVIHVLRRLGARPDETKRAAALCETMREAPLEQRVRLALSCLRPIAARHVPAPAPA